MTPKTGLLLVNLGSPDAPTPKAVRRYLFQFLHDHRVIELTRWIWCFILHGIILRVRPARSAKAYAKIWGAKGREAPLIEITRAQATKIQKRLGQNVSVNVAMRYGNPSIPAAMDVFAAAGIDRIAVLPLYPQYAAATTASVYDDVFKALKKKRDMPALRFLRNYYEEPAYIAALADSISAQIDRQGWEPDAIIASFHGLPVEMVEKGDPYKDECQKTAERLGEALGARADKLILTFQSRFGPKEWLQPYTDKTLEKLAGEGKTKIICITPGFAADCLETLEEIAIEARDDFISAGGTHFEMVPCLNAQDDHCDLLADIARRELLSGWE
ncbi:ferrochelatase [Robiginitomaculum antarcticum]|uniref:ferrochelatase n=1 Tax=Robiginitomaculum antarcticum TaxID=437507 RepID=UPI00037209DB|nr:ferrochelatase [Robiginitomaculum antarcticum]